MLTFQQIWKVATESHAHPLYGHPKQYVPVGTVFNTAFILDFQEHVFRTVKQNTPSGAGSSGTRKVCFEDVNKDMFMEVQNERCS